MDTVNSPGDSAILTNTWEAALEAATAEMAFDGKVIEAYERICQIDLSQQGGGNELAAAPRPEQ